jgi:hypothetical protein
MRRTYMSQESMVALAITELMETQHVAFFQELARDWGRGDPVREEALWKGCSKKERFAILKRLMEIPKIVDAYEVDTDSPRGNSISVHKIRGWSRGEFNWLPYSLQVYMFLSECQGVFTVDAVESKVREYFPPTLKSNEGRTFPS